MLEPDDIIPSFLDELEKIAVATSLAKKKGLGRLGELLTGSRVEKLEKRQEHLKSRQGRIQTVGYANMHAAADKPVKEDKYIPGLARMERTDNVNKEKRRASSALRNNREAERGASRQAREEREHVFGARMATGAAGAVTGVTGLVAGASAVGKHLDKKDKERERAEKLKKTAASFGRSLISKSREGRRPISVAKYLKKDKEGTLFRKLHKEAETYQDYTQPKASVEDPRPRKKTEMPTRVEVGDSPARVVGT